MLLQAEFLAISLVLVYVGAVMVLFLFVVMMLDINSDSVRQGFWKHFPAAGLIGVVIALEMSFVLTRRFRPAGCQGMPPEVAGVAQCQGLGHLTCTPVPVSRCRSLPSILLVAIIAAIALTLRQAQGRARPEAGRTGSCSRRPTVCAWTRWLPCVEAPAAEADANKQAGGPSMTSITLGHYLSLGAILFTMSIIGIFMNRKNLIVLLMAIELMLLAVNLNFVAFSHYLGDMAGQVFVLFHPRPWRPPSRLSVWPFWCCSSVTDQASTQKTSTPSRVDEPRRIP